MERNDDIIAVGLLIIPGAYCVTEEFPVMFFWVWPLSSLDFMSDSVTSLSPWYDLGMPVFTLIHGWV